MSKQPRLVIVALSNTPTTTEHNTEPTPNITNENNNTETNPIVLNDSLEGGDKHKPKVEILDDDTEDEDLIDDSDESSSTSTSSESTSDDDTEDEEYEDIDYDSIMGTTLNAAKIISDGEFASDSTGFFSGGAFIGDILTDVLSGGYLEGNETVNEIPIEEDTNTNTPFSGGNLLSNPPTKIIDGFPYKLKSTPEF